MGCLRYSQILPRTFRAISVMRHHWSKFVVVACVVALQACAVSPKRTSGTDVSDDIDSIHVSEEMGDLKQGDMVEFRSGKLAKFGTITIGRQYNAASGRSCKQILDASGDQLLSVTCQLPSKQWYVRESLNIPANTRQSVPAETDANPLLVPVEPQTQELKPVVEDENDKQEPISFRVKVNETLYSFARRTTGDALNWEEIARYNGIENELELVVGTALKIPVGLQGTER